MDTLLRRNADEIITYSINSVLPDTAVARALEGKTFPGRVYLVAVGKAAWRMAKAATEELGDTVTEGVVITKYGHAVAPIGRIECYEAGHPVPDENSFTATDRALDLVSNLGKSDTVLFLLSGGGSALFEKPLVPAEVLQDITKQLLACGADIKEINTIRKRLSAVKGGRFAQACWPANIFSIVLSDVLGDPLDMIASGPTVADSSTCEDAVNVIEKYSINISQDVRMLLQQETPNTLDNSEAIITGSVRQLCTAAAEKCSELGYKPIILTDRLSCNARDAGCFLASILKTYSKSNAPVAFIAGGETVVKLTGSGLGGRNQELALAAATGISELRGCAVFSVGSDGTDGPTDAAGGYVDYETASELKKQNIDVYEVLQDNDSYHALKKTGGLIVTGPTGTNVNDVSVALFMPV